MADRPPDARFPPIRLAPLQHFPPSRRPDEAQSVPQWAEYNVRQPQHHHHHHQRPQQHLPVPIRQDSSTNMMQEEPPHYLPPPSLYGHAWHSRSTAPLPPPPLRRDVDQLPGQRVQYDIHTRHRHRQASSSSTPDSLAASSTSTMRHPAGPQHHSKTLSLDRRYEAAASPRVQPYHLAPLSPSHSFSSPVPPPLDVVHGPQSAWSPSWTDPRLYPPPSSQSARVYARPSTCRPLISPYQHDDLTTISQSPSGPPPPPLHRTRSHRSETDREEANRQKSKRHYDRKKDQRTILAQLAAEMVDEVQQLRQGDVRAGATGVVRDVLQALDFRLPMASQSVVGAAPLASLVPQSSEGGMSSTSSALDRCAPMPGQGVAAAPDSSSSGANEAAGSMKRANERKRLNKLTQRHLEMQRIQQLSYVARALEPAVRPAEMMSKLRRPLSHATPRVLDDEDDEARALYALLQPWLRCREAWSHLLLAEERLSLMTGRPMARIIGALRALVDPVEEAGETATEG